MKKSTVKAVIVTLCVVIVAAASVVATLAYLVDKKEVTNTFTVGDVDIKLDEAKVIADGKLDGTERVTENNYHLIPGQTYIKDPTVTVLEDSEDCYVRIMVTVNEKADLIMVTIL